jgi:hypothetical protein
MLNPCGSLIVTAALAFVASPTLAGPLTTGDRPRVLSHLEMTESWLVSELEGLSAAQLTFRMSPDSWSIQAAIWMSISGC